MPNHALPPGLKPLVVKASGVQIDRALGRLVEHVSACQRQAVTPEPPARFFYEALGLELLGIGDEAPAEYDDRALFEGRDYSPHYTGGY